MAEAYDGGKVEASFQPEEWGFTVKFVDTLGIPPNLEALKSAIEEIKPAHLVVAYAFNYLLIRDIHNVMTFEVLKQTPFSKMAFRRTGGYKYTPKQTPNMNLYKVDGEADRNDTFNVDVVLNDNWDKIDLAVGQIQENLENIDVDIPDASLTQKGIVQLSSTTNGTRENVAATEKAVKDAAFQAKSYTDQQISLVTETGIPKLVSYPLLVTATADNQKVFEIPLIFSTPTPTPC